MKNPDSKPFWTNLANGQTATTNPCVWTIPGPVWFDKDTVKGEPLITNKGERYWHNRRSGATTTMDPASWLLTKNKGGKQKWTNQDSGWETNTNPNEWLQMTSKGLNFWVNCNSGSVTKEDPLGNDYIKEGSIRDTGILNDNKNFKGAGFTNAAPDIIGDLKKSGASAIVLKLNKFGKLVPGIMFPEISVGPLPKVPGDNKVSLFLNELYGSDTNVTFTGRVNPINKDYAFNLVVSGRIGYDGGDIVQAYMTNVDLFMMKAKERKKTAFSAEGVFTVKTDWLTINLLVEGEITDDKVQITAKGEVEALGTKAQVHVWLTQEGEEPWNVVVGMNIPKLDFNEVPWLSDQADWNKWGRLENVLVMFANYDGFLFGTKFAGGLTMYTEVNVTGANNQLQDLMLPVKDFFEVDIKRLKLGCWMGRLEDENVEEKKAEEKQAFSNPVGDELVATSDVASKTESTKKRNFALGVGLVGKISIEVPSFGIDFGDGYIANVTIVDPVGIFTRDRDKNGGLMSKTLVVDGVLKLGLADITVAFNKAPVGIGGISFELTASVPFFGEQDVPLRIAYGPVCSYKKGPEGQKGSSADKSTGCTRQKAKPGGSPTGLGGISTMAKAP